MSGSGRRQSSREGGPELDGLELGRTVQLLYDAFSLIEGVGGSLSPYVPTLGSVAEPLAALAAAWAEARAAARGAGGTPVYYEPGCGAARFASLVAREGTAYTLCLELDEALAREAHERLKHASPLADTIVGDLASFRPRRSDTVYAYLLPRAVQRLLEALDGSHAPVISLDYPAEEDRGHLSTAILEVLGRRIYVYQA